MLLAIDFSQWTTLTGWPFWLPLIWAFIIGVAITLYVVLDGFDLGLGILFPVMRDEEKRDVMMNSVAPFWDGNETWLVMGGAGLFVAFPKAYALIMPAVYLPLLIMLLALVLRGVSFEFRWVSKPKHDSWDFSFWFGSTVATFMQGVILGVILEGIPAVNGVYAGGALDWVRPFPLFVGLALVAGYALLGVTWLVMKTAGEVQAEARHMTRPLLLIVLAAMAIVSLWTPLAIPRIHERWFSWPNTLVLSPVPLAVAFAAWRCWVSAERGADAAPFIWSIVLFLLGSTGLMISNAPYFVPPTMSAWDAAAVPKAQEFALVGTAIFLPIILGYTAFVYWTFRGKTREGEGYHDH